MKEQNFSDIEKSIRQHGYCAVIEVCNGISNKALERKIDEAIQARKFIAQLTQADTRAGLMFFRKTRLNEDKVSKTVEEKELDFIGQIPQYETPRAIRALLETRDLTADKNIAEQFAGLLQRGTDLKDIFYPEDWNTFRKQFPQLAQDYTKQQYMDKIGNFKGIFLQIYARKLCRNSIGECTIYEAVRYEKRGGLHLTRQIVDGVIHTYGGRPGGEIDLIITGNKDKIVSGLKKHFTLCTEPATK